jgi:hypothetical protein
MRARLILSACAALALAAGARVHADEGHKGSTTAYEPPNDPQRPKAGTESTATGDTSASQSSPSTSGRSTTPGHSSTSSDTSAGSAQASASGKASDKTLTGTIDQVKEDKITVRDGAGMTRELSLDANTRFLREGKSISRKDLQAGDEVRASLQDDKHVSEISVVQSGGDADSKAGAREPGSSTVRSPVGGPEKMPQPGSEAEKSPSTTK